MSISTPLSRLGAARPAPSFLAFVALVAGWGGSAHAGTLTAGSGSSPVAFPDASGAGFEDGGGETTYGQVSSPGNQWGPWVFGGDSGITDDSSPLTALNPSAPEGQSVGFLRGAGTVEASHAFAIGTYRLRLKAAQRGQTVGTDTQVVRATIDGETIAEWTPVGSAYAELVSRPFTFDVATTGLVTLAGLDATGTHVAFVDEVRLEPVANWAETSTWGGAGPPTAADDVIVPAGVSVALTGPSVASTITVHGELLASNRDVTVDAVWVRVGGAGSRLEVGTAAAPFPHEFTLTLTATASSGTFGIAGTKFLMAMDGGTIDLHGKPKRSWTRLDGDVAPAAGSITVADPVDWEAGDEIVLAGTVFQPATDPDPSYPNYIDYSDQVTVQSVDPTGLVVTLDPSGGSVMHPHLGGAPATVTTNGPSQVPLFQSWTVDLRAEVGLLTHNVKVQGNAASDVSEFGGHIMIMRPSGTTSGGRAYLSNVELFRMGQKQVLGRYPMHWHLMLDLAEGQFITDSSVHRSYNRAITIHGTDHVEVSRSVVHDTVGHAIFLEDGSEQFNTITDNLVLTTIKPPPGEEMLPSDNEQDVVQNRCPASFWITNPMNTITGNVAAGTEGTGFWFIFPEAPMGLSQTDPEARAYFAGRVPIETALGVFDGNVAHSCGTGFDVNDSIRFDRNDPTPPNHTIVTDGDWDPPGGQEVITNFTAWNCDIGIYAGVGEEELVYWNCVLAANFEGVRLASPHTVRNSLLVAVGLPDLSPHQFGYMLYDGPGRLETSHFEDYVGTSVLGNHFALAVSSGAAQFHTNSLFSGLTHEPIPNPHSTVLFPDYASMLTGTTPATCGDTGPGNADAPYFWGAVLRDVDGTLLSFYNVPPVPGLSVVGNHPLMSVPIAPWIEYPLPNSGAVASVLRYGHLVLRHPGIAAASVPNVTMQRLPNSWTQMPGSIPLTDPGSAAYLHCFKRFAHKQWPVVVESGFTYRLDFVQASSTPGANHVTLTLEDVDAPDSLYLVLPGLAAGGGLSVANAVKVADHAALLGSAVTSYCVTGTDMELKFVDVAGAHEVDVIW